MAQRGDCPVAAPAAAPAAPIARERRRRWRALRCTAAALAGGLLQLTASSARGWVSSGRLASGAGPSALPSGRRWRQGLAAVEEDISDIILLPLEEESLFSLESAVEREAPPAEKVEAGAAGSRGGAARKPFRAAPPVDLEGGSGVPSLDEAASRVSLALKTEAAAGKPEEGGGKKRWLAGRGSAKRRKLEENNNLVKWLVSNGVWVSDKADWGRQSAGVQIAVETRETTENEISGRGVVAARDINLYEELARVPMRLLLTKDSARDKFGADCIADNMSEYSAIAVQLISEKFQEKESFFEPYIAVLPSVEEIGASFAWPDEELDMLLAGSPLQNMSYFLRGKVIEEFEKLDSMVLSKDRKKFPADIFTVENYVWAYAILFSRAVRLDFDDRDEFIALVPYVDLINHSPNSQTYITGIRDGVELPFGLQDKDRYIIIKADRYYSQYEQIYISYGPKSNAQLLMLYGFSLMGHAGDFVHIAAGSLLDNDPLKEAKQRLLAERGIKYEAFPLYRDRFTSEMMQFFRLLAVDPEDLGPVDLNNSAAVDAALRKLPLRQAFGEMPERKSLLRLRVICQEMLAAYPTTLEDDEKLIQDRSMFELLPKNHRNAVRVRYQEKVILQASLNTIDRILNNLVQLTEIEQEKQAKQRANKDTILGRLGLEVDPVIGKAQIEEFMKALDL